jgi:hypothetical protein
VAEPGTVRVEVPRAPRARRAELVRLGGVAAGTPVALLASGPGAIGRCRRFAARAGVAVDRAYLAFPSATAPAYLVEDAACTVRVFTKTMLVAPLSARFATPMMLAVAVLRWLSPWRLLRALAPGRVVVGRRA